MKKLFISKYYIIGFLLIFIIIISSSVIISFFLGLNIVVFGHYLTESLYDNSNCTGITYFFTNTTFEADEKIMHEYYRNCYDSEEIYFKKFENKVYPPEFLYKCEHSGYDCEDYAFAVLCLAELYNTECNQYVEHSYNIIDNITWHVGTECKLNDRYIKIS